MLEEEELKSAILVVLANKQDIEGAMSVTEVRAVFCTVDSLSWSLCSVLWILDSTLIEMEGFPINLSVHISFVRRKIYLSRQSQTF